MNKHKHKYFRTLFLLLTLLIVHSSLLIATIRYVSKTGLSIPPYITWETAADSIQKCINICVFGDTIYVANGIYKEQVVMIEGLSLIGNGADSTIINTQSLVNSNGFVAVEVKDSCLFKGFQIVVYYNSDKGYGIAQSGNSVVKENKISTAAYGMYVGYTGMNLPLVYNNSIYNVSKGIDIFNSYVLVRSNTIYTDPNSSAAVIAGIRIAAFGNESPTIDSNYIENNNPVGYCITKDLGSSPIIKNNVLYLKGVANEAINSGIGGVSRIINNLIIAENGYDGIYGNGSTKVILNNYIIGNLYSYGINHIGPGDTVKNNVITKCGGGISVWNNQNTTIQYNNTWENGINHAGFLPDSTNLSVDPMVVNDDSTQGELDFHLQMYSPLIDAGDPNIFDKDSTRSDIGLYGGPYGESYVYQDLPPKPPKNLTAVVDSSLITLTWKRNTEADFNHYNLYRDTINNFHIDSTKLVASVTDTFYYNIIPTGVESLYFKLTGVDNQGNESRPSDEVAVILVSVNNELKPENNYVLYQNYPNPFNPSTKISYKLKERSYVKLYIYDVTGELVSVLVNQYQEAGNYEVEFGGGSEISDIGIRSAKGGLASGVYIYQIIVSNERHIPVFSDMGKMVLLK